MKVNDNAGRLKHPGALEFIASNLAPTKVAPESNNQAPTPFLTDQAYCNYVAS